MDGPGLLQCSGQAASGGLAAARFGTRAGWAGGTPVAAVNTTNSGRIALPPVTDFLVIGGGVIGLTLALECRRRHPDCRVTLIEKESGWGRHATGRSSGVLHAGFYYTADSLKARFTRRGNQRWTEYCRERGLLLHCCGKLVVARSRAELDAMEELVRRARRSGVALEELSAAEARKIEPRVRTFERALFSPTTAVVNPRQIVEALVADARLAGVELVGATAYRGRRGAQIETTAGPISAGYVINAAGLYADTVARDFGFSERYRILPFKGLYLHSAAGAPPLRTNIYPVPRLDNPFLGVHLTVTPAGGSKVGPTAIPAFWREHYRGGTNFRWREFAEIVGREGVLFLRNDSGFRGLALRELPKYWKPHLLRLAAGLATGIERAHYPSWGPAGIRAQLFDVRRRTLEMDFCLEGDDRSFHVLNAVSPAFTCAIPFSEFVLQEIGRRVS